MENGLKSARISCQIWVNKDQKWRERVYFIFQTSFFGGLRSCWSSKYGVFIILRAGQLRIYSATSKADNRITRYEGDLNLFYPSKTNFGPRCTQTPEKNILRHILTCFFHFWVLFCLKPTRTVLLKPFLGDQNFPNASNMDILT